MARMGEKVLADLLGAADTSDQVRPFLPGGTVAAFCFLSVNFSVAIALAAYRALVVAIQEQFGTFRALASTGLSAAGPTLRPPLSA